MSCLANFPTTNIIYNCKDDPAPEDHAVPTQDQPDPPQPAVPSRKKRKRKSEISELKRKLDAAFATKSLHFATRSCGAFGRNLSLARGPTACKRERARRAILATKKRLSQDPKARWKKQRIIQNYINYHPEISCIVDDD